MLLRFEIWKELKHFLKVCDYCFGGVKSLRIRSDRSPGLQPVTAAWAGHRDFSRSPRLEPVTLIWAGHHGLRLSLWFEPVTMAWAGHLDLSRSPRTWAGHLGFRNFNQTRNFSSFHRKREPSHTCPIEEIKFIFDVFPEPVGNVFLIPRIPGFVAAWDVFVGRTRRQSASIPTMFNLGCVDFLP